MRPGRFLTAAVTAAALLTGPPAGTAGQPIGTSCGADLTREPLSAPSNWYYVLVTAGPLVVPDHTTQWIEITCSFRSAAGTVDVVCRLDAPAAACAKLRTMEFPPGTAVYLCTSVTWRDASGTHRHDYDGDDTLPGQQCHLVAIV